MKSETLATKTFMIQVWTFSSYRDTLSYSWRSRSFQACHWLFSSLRYLHTAHNTCLCI